jgi:hypothetical protein
MLSRRRLLRSGSLSAFSLLLLSATRRLSFGQGLKTDPNFDFPIPLSAVQDPLYHYKQSAFQMFVGTPFNLVSPKANVTLTLNSVTGYQPSPNTVITTKPPRPCESFSLSFAASGPLPTKTTLYTVNHAALGKFNLFLRPQAIQKGQLFYEAAFSRLVI